MSDHDPLTCRRCNPEPWAHAELTREGKTRRVTGWAAVAVVLGPFLMLAFMLGMVAGIALTAVTR